MVNVSVYVYSIYKIIYTTVRMRAVQNHNSAFESEDGHTLHIRVPDLSQTVWP